MAALTVDHSRPSSMVVVKTVVVRHLDYSEYYSHVSVLVTVITDVLTLNVAHAH